MLLLGFPALQDAFRHRVNESKRDERECARLIPVRAVAAGHFGLRGLVVEIPNNVRLRFGHRLVSLLLDSPGRDGSRESRLGESGNGRLRLPSR